MSARPEGAVPYEHVETILLVLINLYGPRLMIDSDKVKTHIEAACKAWQQLPGAPNTEHRTDADDDALSPLH